MSGEARSLSNYVAKDVARPINDVKILGHARLVLKLGGIVLLHQGKAGGPDQERKQ